MPNTAQSRNGTLTKLVDRVPLLSVHDLAMVACFPGMTGAAAQFARQYYPRFGLGRLG